MYNFIRLKKHYYFILYSQIRLIVGAALMVAKGMLPIEIIELALKAELYIPLPVAPAEGLLLVNAGFGYNANDQVIIFIYN
jgi:tRNA U38,U39,U40 pseudouridine synthase TruA